MPGGMRPVEQSFSADATGYIAEIERMVGANIALGESIDKEVLAKISQVSEAFRNMPAAAALTQVSQQAREAAASVREASAAAGEFSQSHLAAAASVGAANAAIREHLAILGQHADAQAGSTAAVVAATEALREHAPAVAAVTDSVREQGTVADDTAARVLSYADSLAEAETRAEAARVSVDALGAAVTRASAAGGQDWLSGVQTRGGFLTGDAISAALAAGAAGAAQADAARSVSDAVSRGVTDALTTAGVTGGGAGGGGGGGGLAAAAGGFFGAFRPSNIFGAAVPTLQAAHMITMFTMETLSTVIPAMVAAGAAGAVGLQGAGNVYLRGQGLYASSEALGGAYGTTFGQMIGLGSGFQQAQNIANGGVYGITGGILDLARGGQGAFGAMGDQAIAMIDRGIAAMVLNNRMGQVTSALAGGPGDLRAFGDIAANIGDTLLNLAPNLPGIGPMLLGGLKGITGAASWITGHVPGPVLATALAAEAGYRYGPLILGGGQLPRWLGGRTITGLAGVAERMGLGTTATTMGAGEAAASMGISAGDLAAIYGGAGLAVPEMTAEGTGLAGVLGGLAGGAFGGAALGTAGLGAVAALGAILLRSMPTPAMRQVAGWQAGISQSFGAGAWQPITSALYDTNRAYMETFMADLPNKVNQITRGATGYEYGRFGPVGPGSEQQIYAAGGQSFAQQLGNLIAAGPQAVKALQDIGVKGASLGEAFQAMTMAMISPGEIGAGGKLSATARQQLKQFVQTYSTLMGPSGAGAGGAYAGAVLGPAAADYIMSTTQMKDLSQLNQAMDSMTQIMMGGAAGQAALTGVSQALLTTSPGLPSVRAFAKALAAGPQTGAGAAAWTAFTTGTATTPGVISTLQQNMDQLRTDLTLGALNAPQAAALGAYQVGQYMPDVQGSALGTAMLMQQAMQAGVPGMTYYDAKLSPQQNYANAMKALTAHPATAAGANALITQAGISTADIPATAMNLLTGGAGTPSIAQQALTNAATQALQVQGAVLGGKPDTASLSALVGSLIAGGVKGVPELQTALRATMEGTGLTGAKLAGVVQAGTVIYKSEVEPPKPPPAPPGPPVRYPAHTDTPHPVPPPPGGTVQYKSHVQPPVAPPAPAGGTVVYHSVVLGPAAGSGTTAGSVGTFGGTRLVGQSGFKVPGGYGGGDIVPAMLEPGELVVPKDMVASGAVDHLQGRIPGFQGGGVIGSPQVPYFASLGVPFMVAMNAAFSQLAGELNTALGNLHVPVTVSVAGTGAGGLQPSGGGTAPGGKPAALQPDGSIPVHIASVSPAAAANLGGTVPGGGAPMPAAAQKVLDAFEKTFAGMGAPWGKLASQYLQGFLSEVKNPMKETAAQAQSIVNQVSTAITYGQGVAAAAKQGTGYNPWGGAQTLLGTFGNLPAPTMTAGGAPYQYYIDQQAAAAGGTLSVQQQMGDYLQAEQSFKGDLGKLSKAHLNKNLMQQLIAAGPLQGDELAQSILGGPGGVGAANKLWSQIGQMSNQLGVTGMEAVYGAPKGAAGIAGLHGKSVHVAADVTGEAAVRALGASIEALSSKTVTLKVSLDLVGGAGGGSAQTMDAAVNNFVEQVQKKLLQQAKRNRKTGIQLPGYGS